jgi:hypothetical protein
MTIEPQRTAVADGPPLRVPSTSAWVHRCAKRMLELDPELDPLAAMHTVDDMARITRWRTMLPEDVAEALYARAADEEPLSFASRPMRNI